MSIQVKTERVDKYGRPEYAYLSIEEGLELYEGKLYKLLQKELGVINNETERTKEYAKYLRELAKKCGDLGIKPLKEGSND
jgi:hypothetical protein